MSFVKNYDPGKIHMDLPTSNYIYELPILSFSDIHGAVNLSLVFNYRMREERGNLFHIAAGYKLNLQKCLILEDGNPQALLEEDGKCTNFISTGGVYVLDNDDQRILRRSGTDFVLENMDYSKEIYDNTGKIVSAYDKYSNLVLSYGYDSSGRMTTITYRGSKIITFTYLNSQLVSITYANCTTTLEYETNKTYINHYSGMKYSLLNTTDTSTSVSTLPWRGFRAVAVDPNTLSVPSHSVELIRRDSHNVDLFYQIGSNTVDTST